MEPDGKMADVACAHNTELLAGQHEELTNEELMEMEARSVEHTSELQSR